MNYEHEGLIALDPEFAELFANKEFAADEFDQKIKEVNEVEALLEGFPSDCRRNFNRPDILKGEYAYEEVSNISQLSNAELFNSFKADLKAIGVSEACINFVALYFNNEKNIPR